MISFFNYLRLVEREVMGDTEYFTHGSRAAIQRLISFIESGDIAGGEATEFICKRWRLTIKELREEWKKETGVNKSAAAFRSQICTLSKTLYSLIPEQAFGSLLSENDPTIINQILDALEFDNKPFCTLFPELTQYAIFDGKYYRLEEMRNEIRVLKELKAVEGLFKSMDPSKLGYIKQVLDSRAINNPNKAPLLKALSLC